MAKNRRNQDEKDEEILIDVVEAKESTQDFIEKNKNWILIALLALVVIVGGYFFYKYVFMGPKEKQASAAIYKAEVQFARDSFALALENPGGGFEGFLDIIDNYTGTKTANMAKYYAGISYLNLGRYEDAISYLSDFSPSGSVSPIMKFGALGDSYAENNNMDAALSNYQKATNAPSNDFLTPYYLQKLGMLNQKLGNNEAALKAFSRIKEEFAGSQQGGNIDRFIAQLQ